ncbi:MAG TPA: oligosaccharide flippase family protein [Thermoleophilaceae bacterium]|nr:oligosaccharide flippase family protein [Thermoleophilaceae bacterium]
MPDSHRPVHEPPESPDGGQARRVAAGALTQQIAQVTGLVVLLAVVTVLARRLSLAELGTYGLTATLATYLLIVKNSIGGAAQRAMVAARGPEDQSAAFSTAAGLYALTGLVTGLLIAGVGAGLAAAILDGDLREQAQLGVLGLGAVSAVGLAATVNLDAMRAALLLTRSAANEIAALVVFAALMLTLALSDAPLWALIAASGTIPLLSGTVNLVARRRLGLPFRLRAGGFQRERARALAPTAGWLLLIEVSTLVIYGLDRVVLGLFGSPASIGLYEGPVRAHNVIYALNQSVGVTTLPVGASLTAQGDRQRLRELVLRGSRYTLALFVPLTVTAMAMAAPALEVWLGERFREAAPALTILVSYWLLWGMLAVTPNFLVGAGRARQAGSVVAGIAALNLALSLALTPSLGVEGPALGTAIAYVAGFPLMLRIGLDVGGLSLAELARGAWLPAYALGAVLAALLVGARLALDPDTLVVVLPMVLAGPLAYGAAYYGLVMDASERAFVRSLLRR